MKDKILQLRAEGKSFREIEKILKCSKSLISFHCSIGQKEKSKERTKKSRTKNTLVKKTDNFRYKVSSFQRRNGSKLKSTRDKTFTNKELEEKIGQNPVCYLSGEPIDLSESRLFEFDHILPPAKGGDNSLDNLGLTLKKFNRMKQDMEFSEFLEACQKVLIYNGYKVTKLLTIP